jgi:2-iminobutanoate/2-iminopropanoate deaminase
MKPVFAAALAVLCLSPVAAAAAEKTHFAPARSPVAGAASPAFSTAVMAGETLYVSGVLDSDPANPSKMGANAEESSRFALDALKRGVEAGGLTMDDLVWVQIFCTDLSYYAKFNEVYRTYFKGPLPARAFLGTSQLLNGAHIEVMGVAVKGR